MEELEKKNPWLGLESYKEGEILYGRDDDIRDLSQCVLNDTDTLLYGKSGIGKSSILNAGILPAARRNGYLPVLIRLSHKEKHSYLYQINQAILNAITNEDNALNEAQSLIREVLPCKDAEAEGFYEYFHRHTFHNLNGDRLKLLIIFDQFEEIFTLQDDAQKKKTFFAHLADLLNDIMPDELQQKVEISSDTQEEIIVKEESDFNNIFDDLNLGVENSLPEYIADNDIHFVFTIREDFLSEFEYYSAAIPSLKQNRYGLRPINEEQAAQIILRPIPELIDKSVAKHIIEKITGKKDFELDGVPEIEVDSAVLSLYLNRLYEASEGKTITKELVEQKGVKIISDFYNDAISDISDSTVEYLEDMLLNGQGRRDNITVYDAINDGNISEQELDILCNKKKILRQFNYAGDLRIEYVHDILCPVVEKNKAERKLVAEEKSQNKKLKDLRRQRSITLLGIIILLMCIVFYVIGFHIPISERYASTTKQWGCFVGIESLSKKDASFRPYHFILKKKGLFAKTYTSMECRDRFNNLSTSHGLSPYIVGQMQDSVLADGIKGKLQMVCKWEFIKDPVDKDLVIQERAYDKNDNLVYAFNNNAIVAMSRKKSNEGKPKTIIGSYVDEQGLPLELLMEGYRFIRITYDNNGHDMLVEYFDWDGNPSTNSDGAYQTYYEYDDIGQCTSISSLNIYGKRMIDRADNCGMINTYDGYRQVEALSIDEFGREKAVNDGYSRAKWEYDEYGREIKMSLWNKDEPVSAYGFHQRETRYNDDKNAITQILVDENYKQTSLYELEYDADGNLLYSLEDSGANKTVQNSEYNTDGDCIYQEEITIDGIDTIGVFQYEKKSNIEIREFRGNIYNEYINITTYDDDDRVIDNAYYKLDGVTPYEDDYKWHKTMYFYTDNGESKKSLWYETTDSIVYCSCDGLSGIYVCRKMPNRNYQEAKKYNSDTILSDRWGQYIDGYGNVVEETSSHRRGYYPINARLHERTGDGIGFLTKYKFPSEDFFIIKDGKMIKCDENADTLVSKDYVLPEIYSGKRDTTAVFIQCIEQGRMWHAVILESDRGIKIGEEGYGYNNLGPYDDIVCHNLTTMRTETYNLYELDYWEIYNSDITQMEYDLYYEHYTDYYMKSRISVVHGQIEGDEGYLIENGCSGEFFVLELGDWNCSQSIESFSTIVEESVDKAKNIVLLPYEIIDDEIVYHDIVYIEDCEGTIGLRLQDIMISRSYYQNNILSRYNKWK